MREVYKWAFGAAISYLGFTVSWIDSTLDSLDWFSVIERMGLPTAFLAALLWMIWKGGNAVWPFIREQIERLVDIPNNQLKEERRERQRQQERYEEIILLAVKEQSSSNEKVANALRELTEAMKKQSVEKVKQ